MGLPRTQFESWSAAGVPLQIEYPAAVLEEICADAAEGLARFRHGGAEVGGVLYGTERDGLIRVLDYRQLECEYAFGPRFTLSDRDRERMRDLLRAPQRDPSLSGSVVVGWYHSHTRSGLELSPRDLELHEQLFPGKFQVALVVRPENESQARAAFFLRAQCLFALDVQPRRHMPEDLPAGLSEPEPEPADIPLPARDLPSDSVDSSEQVPPVPSGPNDYSPPAWAAADSGELPLPEAPPPVPALEETDALAAWAQPQPKARRWYWAGLVLLVLAAGAFGVWRYWANARLNAPLSLWVADVGGQLLIEWDRTAGPVRTARSGVIEIRDGGAPRYIQLDPERLREGSVDYVRRSEIVDVKLRVETTSGAHAHELIRFVGQPVLRPAAEEVVKERDELKIEVERLRAEVERLRGRIRPNATR